MEAYKITSKGQVTIPKEVREFLGISKGDRVMFIQKGEDIIIRKTIPDVLDKLLSITSQAELSEEEIMKEIREVREEIANNGWVYTRRF
jgi:AbrB family looped-hinge helix DNA binding protein